MGRTPWIRWTRQNIWVHEIVTALNQLTLCLKNIFGLWEKCNPIDQSVVFFLNIVLAGFENWHDEHLTVNHHRISVPLMYH